MKAKLLGIIDAGRRREANSLIGHVDGSEPRVAGEWTTKDVVAHLAAWREVAAAELDAARTGSPPPDVSNEDDVENAKIYQRTHPQPVRAILQSAIDSWYRLADAVRASDEKDLLGPRGRNPSQPLWQVVLNTSTHLALHLESWCESRGAEADAEGAARWARDVAVDAFPNERAGGIGEYNLACFYAKRGQAGRALPYLEKGLALAPDLRELAQTDSDLDPVRTNPEVAKLLQG